MNAILRPAAERGHANHGWLDTHHSFSFANYYDPRHMGFRSLRVINDDVIKPGAGFGRHGHRDMEIFTYVVSGELTHQDSLGSRRVLRRGDVQVMSAGTGIEHSEFNGSASAEVHLLQIWIEPQARGGQPGYADYTIPEAAKRNQLALLAGPAACGALATLGQDARIYASLLDKGLAVRHEIAAGRAAWLQMINGALSADGIALSPGDGLAVQAAGAITLTASEDSEFLLFDLA
jgi:hypothetical protein